MGTIFIFLLSHPTPPLPLQLYLLLAKLVLVDTLLRISLMDSGRSPLDIILTFLLLPLLPPLLPLQPVK